MFLFFCFFHLRHANFSRAFMGSYNDHLEILQRFGKYPSPDLAIWRILAPDLACHGRGIGVKNVANNPRTLWTIQWNSRKVSFSRGQIPRNCDGLAVACAGPWQSGRQIPRAVECLFNPRLPLEGIRGRASAGFCTRSDAQRGLARPGGPERERFRDFLKAACAIMC